MEKEKKVLTEKQMAHIEKMRAAREAKKAASMEDVKSPAEEVKSPAAPEKEEVKSPATKGVVFTQMDMNFLDRYEKFIENSVAAGGAVGGCPRLHSWYIGKYGDKKIDFPKLWKDYVANKK